MSLIRVIPKARGLANRYMPKRGRVVWLAFNPQTGREQAGRRPSFVVSSEVYNGKVGLALLYPVAIREKDYPFEVVIPEGLPVSGIVLLDQLISLEWRIRRAEFIRSLPDSVTQEVLKKVEVLLR